ncbi:MAG: tetratricopeptide repeat protein [Gammaproteobacteria bacterium]
MKIDWSVQLDTRRWAPLGVLLIAMLVCLAIYWPSLKGPMLYDDFPQLGRFFNQPAGHAPGLGEVLMSNSGPLGRPVSMLTFWINSVLTPDDLAAWKLTNLFIHILCGLLAGLLAMELFDAAGSDRGIAPRYLGAFVGIVWLLHPLQVSAVLYTVQRMTQLAALFSFAGLYAYARARRQLASASLTRTAAGLVMLSVATILAVLSKENGLLLPFLALAVEVLLFHGAGTRAVSRVVKCYFGSIVLLAVAATALAFALKPNLLIGSYAFRNFTLPQRLLSEPRILFDYLGMLLFPIPGSMGFFHDDVALSTGLLHPVTTLLSLFGLTALAASAWLARKRFPLYALGVAFFLIGQSMESSFIALKLMFEHRNYLPSFGVFLGITDLAAWSLARCPPVLRTVLTGAAILSLLVLLAVRVAHWSSGLSFYAAAAIAHPNSDGAISGLAQAYLDAGKPELALQALSGHTSLGTQLQRAYIECKMRGSLPNTQLDRLADNPLPHLDTYPVSGLTLLGALGIENHCRFDDVAYSRLIDRAAALDTTGPTWRYMLYIYSGYYHQRLHQLEPAIAAMRAAHRISPDTPIPLILSARWYLEAGEPVQADNQLQQALHVDQEHHAGFANDIAQLQGQIKKSTDKSSPTKPQ